MGISYKHDAEDGSRKMSIVDRPVRQVVKLCDIEDTSLLDDITAVRNAAKRIIDGRKEVPQTEVEEIITIKDSGDENIDNIPSQESIDDASSPEEIIETKQRSSKKRKSEVERLKIEDWTPPIGKRSRRLVLLSIFPP